MPLYFFQLWFNRKVLAMEAVANSRRLASATGGGPSTAQPLSQWELKILSIMGDGFGERQTGAMVPAFPEVIILSILIIKNVCRFQISTINYLSYRNNLIQFNILFYINLVLFPFQINECMPSTSRETGSQPLLQPLSLDLPEEVQDEGNYEPTQQTDPILPVSQLSLYPRDCEYSLK